MTTVTWTRHSRRSEPLTRSAIAVACGARPGVRLVRIPRAAACGMKSRSELVSRSRIRKRGHWLHDYVVGPRSALAWLIDRYQVKTDKASGIVNDVNDWGHERGEPLYILDLVKRIVTISVETVRIVRGLPELREAE